MLVTAPTNAYAAAAVLCCLSVGPAAARAAAEKSIGNVAARDYGAARRGEC